MVLWRVAIECFIAMNRRKDGEKFLRLMAEKLASEESLAEVLPIRPAAMYADQRRARRQAIAIFKQVVPVFLARVPRR